MAGQTIRTKKVEYFKNQLELKLERYEDLLKEWQKVSPDAPFQLLEGKMKELKEVLTDFNRMLGDDE